MKPEGHKRGEIPRKIQTPVLREYKKQSPAIIAEYKRLAMHTQTSMADTKAPLDRYQRAACLILATLAELDITPIERHPSTMPLIRETLAIDIGLSVLITEIRANPEENPKFTAFLEGNDNKFVYPTAPSGEESYLTYWAGSLSRCRGDNGPHVLPLAHTLFLLEAFNRERAGVNS